MYARVVIYTHDDDKDELEAKARAGVVETPVKGASRGQGSAKASQ